MKLKVTKNLIYPEARKLRDQQQPEFAFAKVVQSLSAKLETKTASTQYNVQDSKITESSNVIVAKSPRSNTSSESTPSSKTSAQPQASLQNKQNSSSNKTLSGQTNAQKNNNKQTEYEHKTNQ